MFLYLVLEDLGPCIRGCQSLGVFASEITKARTCFSSHGSNKSWGLCLLCCPPHPKWLVRMSQMAVWRARADAEQPFRHSTGRVGSGQKGFGTAAPKHYVCAQTQPWSGAGGSNAVGFVWRFLFSATLGISLQLNIGLNSNFVADQ